MVAAAPPRCSSDGLHEVAVDASPASLSSKGTGKQGGALAVGAINLSVDGRASAGPHPAPGIHQQDRHPLEQRGLLRGIAKDESTSMEYAPDSKAFLARINRWWKAFDESYMQPNFGGPALSLHGSMNNLADAAAAQVQPSSKSFTVPATVGKP